ncbi:MAG: DUF3458 domain-containing protein, partial [Pseudomonadota bacterium]
MLKTLVGDDAYARALDLYFERHDGDAATIEDWLKVFEDATGRDLTQFKRWYEDAGTPRLSVEDAWEDGRYTLTFSQMTPPSPGQTEKPPRVIPIAVGLIGPDGTEVMGTHILEMTEERQSFEFENLTARPVPSLLRGFSAPVILERSASNSERAFLLAHDTDPFNKWEAGRALARDGLLAMLRDGAEPNAGYLEAVHAMARDDTLDPAFKALAIGLPSEDELAQALFDAGDTPDPSAIWQALETVRQARAEAMQDTARALYDAHQVTAPYAPDAAQSGARALSNVALGLITRMDGGALAQAQFEAADNMTQQLAAYGCLLAAGSGQAATQSFYDQWQHDRLVIDKWFMMQVANAKPEVAAQTAQNLTEHPDFTLRNPNRFRAVMGALVMNPAGFHAPSGAGYKVLTDWLIQLDPLNPQTTARMCSAFETWQRYDPTRQALIAAELDRILALDGLSRDSREMVSRIRTA